jgi:hypothetical protein
VSYRNLAIDAISKCMGYDPYLPKSEAMVLAWAEALEHGGIPSDATEDVLMAVRVMYQLHGDPGFRPTPKMLVETTRECRKLRRQREAADSEAKAIEDSEKITFAEFRRRHPEVKFPKFGKGVPNV